MGWVNYCTKAYMTVFIPLSCWKICRKLPKITALLTEGVFITFKIMYSSPASKFVK